MLLDGAKVEVFAVKEPGMSFEIPPGAGLLVRIVLGSARQPGVGKEAGGIRPRVLNLFSYTCSFSVAAALGGATVTSSVI